MTTTPVSPASPAAVDFGYSSPPDAASSVATDTPSERRMMEGETAEQALDRALKREDKLRDALDDKQAATRREEFTLAEVARAGVSDREIAGLQGPKGMFDELDLRPNNEGLETEIERNANYMYGKTPAEKAAFIERRQGHVDGFTAAVESKDPAQMTAARRNYLASTDLPLRGLLSKNPNDIHEMLAGKSAVFDHSTGFEVTPAVPPTAPPPELISYLEQKNTEQARALADALLNGAVAPDSRAIQTAMENYTDSLGPARRAGESDRAYTRRISQEAKSDLALANNLEQRLDKHIDAANGAWLRQHGFIKGKYTPGQKIQGLANAVIVKPLKGIGVLANFGLDLLKNAEAIKSALGIFGVGKLPQEIIKKTDVGEGAAKFSVTDAGSAVADKAKEKAKPPEAADGGKAYADATEARDKNRSALQEFREGLYEKDDRLGDQVTRNKAFTTIV